MSFQESIVQVNAGSQWTSLCNYRVGRTAITFNLLGANQALAIPSVNPTGQIPDFVSISLSLAVHGEAVYQQWYLYSPFNGTDAFFYFLTMNQSIYENNTGVTYPAGMIFAEATSRPTTAQIQVDVWETWIDEVKSGEEKQGYVDQLTGKIWTPAVQNAANKRNPLIYIGVAEMLDRLRQNGKL